MSKYPMSHVLLERKCPDTSVRITLVWVTGDTHPIFPLDPYVKIFLLHNGKRIAKKRKTNVKKRTLNPEFNETFVFDLPYSQEELKNVELNFIVFDWDRLSKNEVTALANKKRSNQKNSVRESE